MDIGKNIRYYRKMIGLTQKELAEKTDLKQYALAKYENGTHSPNPEQIIKLASALNVEVQFLFGVSTTGDESPYKLPKGSSREGKLLQAFTKLSEPQQRVIVQQVEALAKS